MKRGGGGPGCVVAPSTWDGDPQARGLGVRGALVHLQGCSPDGTLPCGDHGGRGAGGLEAGAGRAVASGLFSTLPPRRRPVPRASRPRGLSANPTPALPPPQQPEALGSAGVWPAVPRLHLELARLCAPTPHLRGPIPSPRAPPLPSLGAPVTGKRAPRTAKDGPALPSHSRGRRGGLGPGKAPLEARSSRASPQNPGKRLQTVAQQRRCPRLPTQVHTQQLSNRGRRNDRRWDRLAPDGRTSCAATTGRTPLPPLSASRQHRSKDTLARGARLRVCSREHRLQPGPRSQGCRTPGLPWVSGSP